MIDAASESTSGSSSSSSTQAFVIDTATELTSGSSSRFVISEFIDHTCTTLVGSKTQRPGCGANKKNQYFGPHAYTATALVPTVKSMLLHNRNAKPSLLIPLLSDYLLVQPQNQFLVKVRSKALEGMAETPDDDAALVQRQNKVECPCWQNTPQKYIVKGNPPKVKHFLTEQRFEHPKSAFRTPRKCAEPNRTHHMYMLSSYFHIRRVKTHQKYIAL